MNAENSETSGDQKKNSWKPKYLNFLPNWVDWFFYIPIWAWIIFVFIWIFWIATPLCTQTAANYFESQNKQPAPLETITTKNSGATTYSESLQSDAGALGDRFGSINALFTGLAFWGMIIALYMQREELELQRIELKGQQIETKNMARALEAQVSVAADAAMLSALSITVQKAEENFDKSRKHYYECRGSLDSVDFKNNTNTIIYLKSEYDSLKAIKNTQSNKDVYKKLNSIEKLQTSINKLNSALKEHHDLLKKMKEPKNYYYSKRQLAELTAKTVSTRT